MEDSSVTRCFFWPFCSTHKPTQTSSQTTRSTAVPVLPYQTYYRSRHKPTQTISQTTKSTTVPVLPYQKYYRSRHKPTQTSSQTTRSTAVPERVENCHSWLHDEDICLSCPQTSSQLETETAANTRHEDRTLQHHQSVKASLSQQAMQCRQYGEDFQSFDLQCFDDDVPVCGKRWRWGEAEWAERRQKQL